MKTKAITFIFAILLLSCQERVWDNPFDPLCPKNLFSPIALTVEKVDNTVVITWIQNNPKVSGYKIYLSENDAQFKEVGSTGSRTKTWTHANPQGGVKYGYKVISTAGKNMSNGIIEYTTIYLTASISTSAITSITSVSAIAGGNITSDGGSEVTARGVCWSTSQNPTITNLKTTNGSGKGSFASVITGLSPGTTYYVRAYATNNLGTNYGNQVSFTTENTPPVLTTTNVSSITPSTARSGGNITSDGGSEVTARGVCWSTSQNPTITNLKTSNGSGTGSFTSDITGLSPGTTYYVRAYATNSAGTNYGNQVSFTTEKASPVLTTTNISSITPSTARSGGNITSDGGSAVTARGVCWSTSQNPTITNLKTSNGSGTGSFTSDITGLSPGTTYYVRAYATNGLGTGYGNQVSFVTNVSVSIPSVTTSDIFNISTTAATAGGTITSSGNGTITERGIVISSANTNPTVANSYKYTHGSNTTGSFSINVTGLTPNTRYYVRAYATNSAGQGYGITKQFTTTSNVVAPSISTISESNVTTNRATVGGNITSNGNGVITEWGIVYSSSNSSPQIGNSSKVNSFSNKIGVFNFDLTNLSPDTRYYFRAYAINSAGTSYGSVLSFRTDENVSRPSVTTSSSVTNITTNNAIAGGTVTSDGNGRITERGIVYSSTTTSPTVTNSSKVTHSTSSTGSFTVYLTGLNPDTRYYFRAYAKNSEGTGYGNTVFFDTDQEIVIYPGTSLQAVKINNLWWAPVNAGYSSSKPYGLLYQWHRKYGQDYDSNWKLPGPTSLSQGSSSTYQNYFFTSFVSPYNWCSTSVTTWSMSSTYNPCPSGWRVPTQNELYDLYQIGYSADTFDPSFNLWGRWLGSSPNRVFLPNSGYKDSGGDEYNRTRRGSYWASSSNEFGMGWCLVIKDDNNPAVELTFTGKADGLSVRCVKDL